MSVHFISTTSNDSISQYAQNNSDKFSPESRNFGDSSDIIGIYGTSVFENWVKSGKLLRGNARPTVASGLPVDDCYEVIIPEICIGEWVGYNWPFMTSLSVPFRFLLGTDSMQFFNWHFDYANGVCRFELISNKRKLLFNQKEQSIHAIDEAQR